MCVSEFLSFETKSLNHLTREVPLVQKRWSKQRLQLNLLNTSEPIFGRNYPCLSYSDLTNFILICQYHGAALSTQNPQI